MIDIVANDLICFLEKSSGFSGQGLAVTSKGGDFLLIFQEKGAAGEYDSVRIDDRKGNAFYVRLKDGSLDEAPRKSILGSCEKGGSVKAACRIVIQFTGVEMRKVYDCFRSALTVYTRPQIGKDVMFADTTIRRVNFDFTSIAIEEATIKEREQMTGWEGMINLLAIDFDLNYIHEGCACAPQPLC